MAAIQDDLSDEGVEFHRPLLLARVAEFASTT